MNRASITDAGSVEGTNINQGSSELFDKSNILGTVSQSSGVPTGAIIERGSNANGEFVKYADGTMICTYTATVTNQAINIVYGPLFNGIRLWTFPSAFILKPSVNGNINWGNGTSWCSLLQVNVGDVTFYVIDIASRASGTTTNLNFTAIGRWF